MGTGEKIVIGIIAIALIYQLDKFLTAQSKTGQPASTGVANGWNAILSNLFPAPSKTYAVR